MEARELLRTLAGQAHQTLEATVADCPPEAAAWTPPGSTLGSIGSIYAHLILAEDAAVAAASGQPPVLDQGNWKARTGLSEAKATQDEAWRAVTVDLGTLREYGAAVAQARDDFLGTVSEEQIAQDIELPPLGKAPAISLLSILAVAHVFQHGGEIAALKGMQGLKGLPF